MSDKDMFDDVQDANDILEEAPAKKTRKPRKKAAAQSAAPVEANIPEVPESEQAVTIYIDEEAGEANYVPVGHNGIIYQIMRGVEVEVPRKVVDVLKDAVAHRVVQVVDPRTGAKENVMRPYNAVPFRIIR